MADINGIVTIGSTPGAATVLLFNETGDTIVASTTSNASTGAYAFTGLPGNTVYRVVVLGNGNYRTRAYGPCTTVVVDEYGASYVSLIHFDGADASTAIVDQGGPVWTANGNAQLDTAQSKFGGASLLLDGTGDYLSTPSNVAFRIEGDWTIEAWVRPAVNDSLRVIASRRGVSSSNNDWQFDIDATGKLRIIIWNTGGLGTSVVLSGGTTITTNAWHHVAATRSGTTWRVFVDGVLDGQSSETSGVNTSGVGVTMIGRHETDPSRDFNGHIDEFRVTKGKALYTANFVPPTQAFPNGRTVSLLHFDGADGSTTFTDAAGGAAWSAAGDVQVDTGQSKFGGSSAQFNQGGLQASASRAADLALRTGAFTVEFFVLVPSGTTPSAFQRLISSAGGVNVAGSFQIWRPNSTASGAVVNALELAYPSGAGVYLSTMTAINDGVWHHVAFTRDGAGMGYCFLDGVLKSSGSLTGVDFSDTNGWFIGQRYDGAAGTYFTGHLDEFRVTKGAARYTANFTPPTAPFPNP